MESNAIFPEAINPALHHVMLLQHMVIFTSMFMAVTDSTASPRLLDERYFGCVIICYNNSCVYSAPWYASNNPSIIILRKSNCGHNELIEVVINSEHIHIGKMSSFPMFNTYMRGTLM